MPSCDNISHILIKIYLKETGCGGVDWIQLVQGTIKLADVKAEIREVLWEVRQASYCFAQITFLRQTVRTVITY